MVSEPTSLFYQSLSHPSSQSCASPHFSSPCPLTITTPANPQYLFETDSWIEPGHRKCLVLFLRKLYQRREFEKEIQLGKRKSGKKRNKRAETKVEIFVFSLLFTQSHAAEKSSSLTTPAQSAPFWTTVKFAFLIFPYSVLWSKRFIRGKVPTKVQHPKDPGPKASSIT